MTWRVAWQDYRNWRRTDLVEPRPPIERRDFETREEADREAHFLRECGYTVSVAPTPAPRRRASARQAKIRDDEPFNADWKLFD